MTHLEIGEATVRSVGADDELALPAEELRSHPLVIEPYVAEIAQHRGIGRGLHGLCVLRNLPRAVLIGVAPGTGDRAYV